MIRCFIASATLASATLVTATLAPRAAGQDHPAHFPETFALAAERAAALEAGLVAGSPESYFYAALHAANEGRLGDADGLLEAWRARHPEALDDPRFRQLAARQALLAFRGDPERTYAHLRETLGLDLAPRGDAGHEAAALPSALDAAALTAEAFLARARAEDPDLVAEVGPRLLARIALLDLSPRARRDLLARVTRPDVPDLATLVVRDLAEREGARFGDLGAHTVLLVEQLDACAGQRPALLSDEAFVRAYVRRLAPGADEAPTEPATRRAHLQRLDRFVARLGADFDGLRAHVLYHSLALDLAEGRVDRDLLLAYLRMPRPASYAEPDHLRGVARLDLGVDWGTGFPPVGDDEALVREALGLLLVDAAEFEPFVGPLRREALAALFAESKLLAGRLDERGGLERWTALLPSDALEALRARVEVRFPRTQPDRFGVKEPVVLTLDVKNVPELLVRMYEVDTLAHFASAGDSPQDVDLSLDLDGLVPHREWAFRYDTPPLQRVRRTFTFDDLTRRGVFVFEFVGNGVSSRALVRKGALTAVVRTGAAGHVFRVLDEEGAHVRDAEVLLGARAFTADAAGEVVVPFTATPGTRTVTLRQGDFAALATFEHLAESYGLSAAIHVERETLLTGNTARLIVRPSLHVAGARASVSLLRDVTLHLDSVDVAGVRTTATVPKFALSDTRDAVHSFRVPPRVRNISARLTATVDVLATGAEEVLTTDLIEIPLNGILASDDVACPFVSLTPEGFVLDVLGRNGEPSAGRALTLELTHADFTRSYSTRVATDAAGRVRLGPLPGIGSVVVHDLAAEPDRFVLQAPRAAGRTGLIHTLAGVPLRVPYDAADLVHGAPVFSLIELRGGAFAARLTPPARLVDGYLELAGLAPGDYSLALPQSDEVFEVRVVRGPASAGQAPTQSAGSPRRIELTEGAPLVIAAASLDANGLTVRLVGGDTSRRVHVFATRYLPALQPLGARPGLGAPSTRTFSVEALEEPRALFASERRISDELRYVLDRRRAPKFPGNMLARPGLLLNPWALDDPTEDMLGVGGGAGGAYGSRAGGTRRFRANGRAHGPGGESVAAREATFPSLDFLAAPGVQLENLAPDADGVVRVPLAALGDRHVVHVVALDAEAAVARRLVRAEAPLSRRDLRLAAGLDPEKPVALRRELRYVAPGEAVTLADAANSDARTFDTLGDVFQLFRTQGGGPELERFECLARWSSLTRDERRERYSALACHELDLFLAQKDPAFFAEVVRPYLANKAEKRFLDHYLLGADLAPYARPWAFAELNVVERILLLRGLGADAARHVRDAVELLPPDAAATEWAGKLLFAAGGLDAWGVDGEPRLEGLLEAYKDRAGLTDAPAQQALGEPSGDPGTSGWIADAREEVASIEGDPFGDAHETLRDQLDRQRGEPVTLGLELVTADAERRKQTRRGLYRAVADTQELAERGYWRVPLASADASLVTPSAFWLDLAAAAPGAPIRSTHFPLATRSVTEMLLALALLDLPFEAGAHTLEVEGAAITMRAASGLYVATETLAALAPADGNTRALVGQDFLRLDSPTVVVDGRERERLVTGEFLRGVPYGCRVVVTNPSGAPLELDLLVEVPVGAIPVRAAERRTSRRLSLAPYQSHSEVLGFYFPEAGTYAMVPLHVSASGTLVARAAPVALEVLDGPRALDTTSWEEVARSASLDAVLAFLDAANLARLDLDRVAWRMQDRGAFERVTALLAQRRVFAPRLWSFALLHRDVPRLREYLATRTDYLAGLGGRLESPLVSLDPVARRWYEHLEYAPLVNGRAHPFGRQPRILNGSFAAQYARFLALLAYEPELGPEHRLAAAYYLFLQDRVGEALAMFDAVDPRALDTRLQYDALDVYAAFYRADADRARAVASRYVEHPVTRWREWFRMALAQLDEAAGAATAPPGGDGDRGRAMDALASGEPALDLAVEGGRVVLTTTNLTEVTLAYRPLDLELVFSTNPFLEAGVGSLGAIQPTRRDTHRLDPAGRTEVALPAELVGRDLLVEARAGGLSRRAVHDSSALVVRVIESYGQVEVRDAATRAPLPRAYVKVYAKLGDGTVRFHKDGYTDLRGRFDYVSVSGATDAPVRYAMFLQHDAHGAEIREVAPPTR